MRRVPSVTPVPVAPLAMALAALLLGACTPIREPIGHSTMPLDVEARHPILLSRMTETATVDVGVHAPGLSGQQRPDVVAFARAFRRDGEGTLAVSVPSGTANERAAVAAARDVRAILAEEGIGGAALAYRPYRPENGTLSPPLLLSYTRVRAAVPNRCALSGDVDMGPRREPFFNFGCATQTNIAAVVANPADLQAPRPMGPPNGPRRSRVLEQYNAGQDPTTQYRQTGGTVSRVGAGGN